MKSDTKIYSSKDVAKRLSIKPVTVRKYSQMLEEKGVPFAKDEKGWREYSEDNIKFLEYLCDMKSMGKSLEESIERIATLYHANLAIAQPAIPLQGVPSDLCGFTTLSKEKYPNDALVTFIIKLTVGV